MIAHKLSDVHGTPREAVMPNWTSRRLLLADDCMGFSLHDTVIGPDIETEMVCVLNPPCAGEEGHRTDGAYPPPGRAA